MQTSPIQQWYSIVRNMRDDSEDSYLTMRFTYRVLHDLERMRVKEKGKFKQRMGPEFESWTSTLAEEFPSELLSEVISDDEFWNLTLKIALGI